MKREEKRERDVAAHLHSDTLVDRVEVGDEGERGRDKAVDVPGRGRGQVSRTLVEIKRRKRRRTS